MAVWTQDDDDKIREMVAKGASAMRIGVALKRKTAAVRVRARTLGCPLPTKFDLRRVLRAKLEREQF
jgi:GcrA cell cycle regulator